MKQQRTARKCLDRRRSDTPGRTQTCTTTRTTWQGDLCLATAVEEASYLQSIELTAGETGGKVKRTGVDDGCAIGRHVTHQVANGHARAADAR